MDKKIIDFLGKHRICVLTTLLPNGSPHSASLHFSSSASPLYFLSVTNRNSRKCKHFVPGEKYPASLVIGFNEEEFIEFQAEGEVCLLKDKRELKDAWKLHGKKYSDSEEDTTGEWIILKFVPKWWRYSEFKPKFFKLESK